MSITQDDIDLVLSGWSDVQIKLELLDDTFSVIEELQGDLLSLSLSVSAKAEIRRTSSATLYVSSFSYLTSSFSSIWLDRVVLFPRVLRGASP